MLQFILRCCSHVELGVQRVHRDRYLGFRLEILMSEASNDWVTVRVTTTTATEIWEVPLPRWAVVRQILQKMRDNEEMALPTIGHLGDVIEYRMLWQEGQRELSPSETLGEAGVEDGHNLILQASSLGRSASAACGEVKVFLSYSSTDHDVVYSLYKRLESDGFKPWIDREDLLPGQNWRREIERAIESSHSTIVCLSERSVGRSGYVQKEIKLALDVLDRQPEGAMFLLPVRLDNCVIPDRLKHIHYADWDDGGGYEKIRRALRLRANQVVEGAGANSG